MELRRIQTGTIQRSAGFAYRGGSFRDARDFAMTALLVKHPKGDVLVDTGFGRHIDQQFQQMPFFFRAITSYRKQEPAREQLVRAGYEVAHLRAIVITHAHWDHVSGLPDFPDVPVLVTREERDFIQNGGWITAVAREKRARYEEYAFDGGPYLGFPKSHDLHRDGSIVIVPAGGHTPGSVIVFVTSPKQGRHALVGDLVWQREGILFREERPWLPRLLADVEPESVRASILALSALHARFPDINLIPAHDERGFAPIPPL
jgi:glyoxylase-like metal-dependent hydrolase (beta-lactamase superfamily II)